MTKPTRPKKKLRGCLAPRLTQEALALIHNSYDIVGDIAVIRVSADSGKHALQAAEAIMETHKNVKTVLAQTGGVMGDLRLRRLEYVAGADKTSTVHTESGCRFNVDLEKCFFSPRLSHERLRIADQVKPGEVVVNMFAGVGCFSILIANRSQAAKVYSIDINPVAVEFMRENVRINRAFSKVIPVFGDAREIVEAKLQNVADRVLMPLPERAYEYLSCAFDALGKNGGWIHYYDFVHAEKDEDTVEKVKSTVTQTLQDAGASSHVPYGRVVRPTGPNWHQIVLDIKIGRQPPK